MTDKIALALAVMVLGFFALDHFVLHWGAALFLAKKVADLSDWIAFWR